MENNKEDKPRKYPHREDVIRSAMWRKRLVKFLSKYPVKKKENTPDKDLTK